MRHQRRRADVLIVGDHHQLNSSIKVVEMAMNIFTPEYIVLAITLLIVGCRWVKKPKAIGKSGASSPDSGDNMKVH